jgi:uncharacterized membrane protein YeaQ/YmgE (transglycosylase-associated protein family)
MNWRLIFTLSVVGVLMGVATVLGITKGMEGLLWLIIAIFCAFWIARNVKEKHFQHGLLVGVIAGSIAPLIQVLLFSTYAANNPEIVRDAPPGWSARTLFLIMTPFIGVVSGLVLGLLTWAAGKVFRKSPA